MTLLFSRILINDPDQEANRQATFIWSLSMPRLFQLGAMELPLSEVPWPHVPGFEGMNRGKSSGQDRWSHQDGWNQGEKTAALSELRTSHWEMKQVVSAPGEIMGGAGESSLHAFDVHPA